MDPRMFWHFAHRRGHGCGPADAFAAGRGGGRGGGPRRGGPFGGGPFGGGGGFPPFGRFPFFRREGRARRGDVRTAILVLLAEEPRNGYQLMQEIEQRSDGAWRPSPGSMYPALQQLEDEGLVRVETTAGGRTFHLTDKGQAEAKAQRVEPAPWEVASDDTHETAAELRDLFRQVAIATMQVGQVGSAAQIAEARKILIEARRALYRLLADDAPADED